MSDYYDTLGVSRSASTDEIQKAYRKLARKFHPDLNPDDKTAQKKFKEVQQAYDVVGDEKKRKMYDQFGPAFEQIGAGGAGPPPDLQGFDFGNVFGGGGGGSGGQVPPELEELLRQFTSGGGGASFDFGGGATTRRRGRRKPAEPGADVRHEVTIPFRTAVTGGEVSLRIRRSASGNTSGGNKVEMLTVKIPAGIDEGQTIRLRGQGEPSRNDGPSGDLLVTVHIEPHPSYRRDGLDLIAKVPVTLAEAALGAKVDIPTSQGVISLKVPPGTSSGARLRAKGQGIKKSSDAVGDLYAEIQIAIPKEFDPESADLVRRLDSHLRMYPRADLHW